MLPIQTTRPERQVRAEDAPAGALILTSSGHLARMISSSSVYMAGDVGSRWVWDLGMREMWSILASGTHELELPEEAISLDGPPAPGIYMAGVDANGIGVEWQETNLQDHWNNTWEWFTFKDDEPISHGAVAYPVRAWAI